MYLTSEFGDREATIKALRSLKESGVKPEDLAVFSDEPLELPKSALARGSHMSLAVVTGAIAFGLMVVGLVYYAQHSYPIITGGMPIFSFWATGVVFYELTMLGAILMSPLWFLFESGLFSKKDRMAAPTFEPDTICVRVRCADDKRQVIQRLLETAGGSNLKSEVPAK